MAEHVDDVSQMTIKSHGTGATIIAIEQGKLLGKSLVSSGLQPSTKTVVVSNAPKVAVNVAKHISKAGYPD